MDQAYSFVSDQLKDLDSIVPTKNPMKRQLLIFRDLFIVRFY